MSELKHYGNLGLGHSDIIDTQLAKLPLRARLLNLGCGPNVANSNVNLVRAACSLAPERTILIFADIDEHAVKQTSKSLLAWSGGVARMSRPAVLDASALPFRNSSLHLIFAFGLFGDPRFKGQTSCRFEDADVAAFVRRVLLECFRVLSAGGSFVVSNSRQRQPLRTFSRMAKDAGFVIERKSIAQQVGSEETPQEQRYLLAITKGG